MAHRIRERFLKKLSYLGTEYKMSRWVTDEEGDVLRDTIRLHNVTDVYESGTANGYSACRMVEAKGTYGTEVTVTTFDPVARAHVWEEEGYDEYKRLITYVQAGFETLKLEPSDQKRLFFIDGEHDITNCSRDLKLAMKYSMPGDVIVLHDYRERKVAKVVSRMWTPQYSMSVKKTDREICIWVKRLESGLEDLAFEHGTDKRTSKNDYVRTYSSLFSSIQHSYIKLLEIGVYGCSSHKMWVDWFTKAKIYGIDIDDSKFDDYSYFSPERLVLDKVDQGNKTELTQYAMNNGPWTIIIDDGGHFWSQQKTSFEVLWDYILPGGYYVVEDTHTSYWSKFNDSDESLMESMLKITNSLSDGPHYKGYYANPHTRQHGPGEELTKYQKDIEYMRYEMGLCIIKKRGGV